MDVFLQALVSGLSIGAMYVLLSVGVALVFGVLNVVNFAQGDFMTVAAYVGFTGVTTMGLGLFMSSLLMVPVLLAVGLVFFLVVVLPTSRRDHEVQFIATFGTALALQGLVQVFWGGNPVSIKRSTDSFALGSVTIPEESLIRIVLTTVAMLALWGFLSGTKLGRRVKATAADPVAAQLLGIDTRRMQLVAVLVSSVLTAAGGYALLTSTILTPTVGFTMIFSAFTVVVLAGLGSLGGALVASIVLGLAVSFTGTYVNVSVTSAVPFAVIFLVLAFRPTGLRGKAAV